jgi:hypothetical protein
VWIRRRDGDFLGAGVLFQISFTCGACSNFFLVAAGYVSRYKKEKLIF